MLCSLRSQADSSRHSTHTYLTDVVFYNSSPWLTLAHEHLQCRGADSAYVEMDINVHKFASLPKKALEAMFTRFDKMVFSAGFCIESRTDDEMPEALFGAAQINFPIHQMCAQWPLSP